MPYMKEKIGFKINDHGDLICIYYYVQSKGEITPGKERQIGEKAKGIQKIFRRSKKLNDIYK